MIEYFPRNFLNFHGCFLLDKLGLLDNITEIEEIFEMKKVQMMVTKVFIFFNRSHV